MFNKSQLEDIAKQLKDSLPSGLSSLELGLEEQFKAILQATFSRLDLVTRAEFDTQSKVLEKTREKIDKLEAQLDAMIHQDA